MPFPYAGECECVRAVEYYAISLNDVEQTRAHKWDGRLIHDTSAASFIPIYLGTEYMPYSAYVNTAARHPTSVSGFTYHILKFIFISQLHTEACTIHILLAHSILYVRLFLRGAHMHAPISRCDMQVRITLFFRSSSRYIVESLHLLAGCHGNFYLLPIRNSPFCRFRLPMVGRTHVCKWNPFFDFHVPSHMSHTRHDNSIHSMMNKHI